MGRLFDEYNSEGADEGLKGYIRDEEEEILLRWKFENPHTKKQNKNGEEKNGK